VCRGVSEPITMLKRRLPSRQLKRLVGDSPGLRGRFRHEHPTIPIDTEPGSAYRAWVNAQRRDARPLGRTRESHRTSLRRQLHERALVADNPVLRDRYEEELYAAELDLAANFESWLQDRSIDPESGRTTDESLAFFKKLLDQKNVGTTKRRGRPTGLAH
jgi:hypothetical protein